MDTVDLAPAVLALADALVAVGVESVEPRLRDVVVEVTPGQVLEVGVESVSVARPGLSRGLDERRPLVVVADQIAAPQRAELDEARVGWLDRRGHLKLRSGPVVIDADVPPSIRPMPGRGPGLLVGPVAMAVALAALTAYPEAVPPVRELARRFDVSPSGVSTAASRLIAAGLLTRDRHAAVPALFWEAADAWSPSWVALDGVPPPSKNLIAVGTGAAAALGAPVVVRDAPLELLAEHEAELRAVVRRLDGTKPRRSRREVRVALAPSPAAFLRPTHVSIAGHRCAAVPVVAVSIAGDRSRGAEIAESWELPDRVW